MPQNNNGGSCVFKQKTLLYNVSHPKIYELRGQSGFKPRLASRVRGRLSQTKRVTEDILSFSPGRRWFPRVTPLSPPERFKSVPPSILTLLFRLKRKERVKLGKMLRQLLWHKS